MNDYLAQLADRCAEVSGSVRSDSKIGTSAREMGVPKTSEFFRIQNLPRRLWSDSESEALAVQLTAALKQPRGEQSLRPVQAIALLELYNTGLFGVIRVGGGKTLITLLAPVVLGAVRPLLVLPAKLIKKTEREMLILARHWKLPLHLRIISYEKLGRKKYADYLTKYNPDFLIFDEVHKIKNPRAAVTRRVTRHYKATQVKTAGLSGTITKRSIKDCAHIAHMCLPEGCPFPEKFHELDNWANALDEKTNPVNRVKPGALLELATEEERETLDPIVAARRGFGRRLMETPGVVKTDDNRLGTSLLIESVFLDRPNNAISEQHFEQLRRDWEVPDGHPLVDAVSVWRHAREMALGFYYRWNPWPPQVWIEPRRAWGAECRQILNNNRRGLDSELQVVHLVKEHPELYPTAAEAYREWKLIEPIFTPNTEAVWFDDAALQFTANWAENNKGLVWVEQTAFAKKLAELTGMPFYHQQGIDKKTGQMVEDEKGDRSVIVSTASNFEGRNLQHAFHQNFVTSCPTSGSTWEQKLGRTHRDGQLEDEVTCQVLFNCLEQCTAMHQAVRDSYYMQDSTQQEYRLCYADKEILPLDRIPSGWRWQK